MDGIDPLTGKPPLNTGSRKKKKTGKSEKGLFSRLMESEPAETRDTVYGITASEGAEGGLEELLDGVHHRGDLLKQYPSPERVRDYKQAVRRFMAYIVAHSLNIEEHAGARLSPFKKQKKYTQIQVIDEKLEKLGNGVMKNQQEQLELLGKVEEINGLLIDLMS